MSNSYPLITAGQHLADLLAKKGWTKRVLATVIGMDEAGLSRIIASKKPISAELALVLEEVFDTPAEQFLELQFRHDLAVARLSHLPSPDRGRRAHLFGNFPVADMLKRGWIVAESVKDVAAVERELNEFLNAANGDVPHIAHAAKKTDELGPTTGAQLAWLYRCQQIARGMLVARFSELSARRAVNQLQQLLRSREEARKVPRVMAECGIRFLIVEALPGAKIDGACFWLDDSKPVIAMTLRYDRIDNFWFVLRHELEHVIRGDGRSSPIIDDLDGASGGSGPEISEAEQMANAAAAEFCVPSKTLDAFIARKQPYFADRDIQGLANTLGVHPGLVVGQLARRTGRYDRFRAHLEKIKSVVAPSAIIDGWGEVAPTDL